MGNLFRKGAKMLSRVMAVSASDRVEYRRGADAIYVDATRGRHLADSINDEGIVIKARFDDFLVPTEQLKVSGVPFDPVAGDYIIDRTGAAPIAYQVCSTPTEPCWRFSDANHLRVRIHTKQVPLPDA